MYVYDDCVCMKIDIISLPVGY